MLNVLCVIGVIVGLAMVVASFLAMDIERVPSLKLFICGLIITAVSMNGYDYAAKKMKYDAEKNAAKTSQRGELHRKFLDAVKDDPDFKICFESAD